MDGTVSLQLESQPTVPQVVQLVPPEMFQAVMGIWIAMQETAGQARALNPNVVDPDPSTLRTEVEPRVEARTQPEALVLEMEGPPVQISKLLKEARILGCESFEGYGDVSVAHQWLDRVARAARDKRLIEADQVTLATRLLEADVEIWSSIQTRYPVQPSWKEFVQEFNKQYSTQYHCD